MPTLLLRFPGGRYHATPWGHHVNEGLIEWPPSPWRLLRALLSTGYTALGWGGNMGQPMQCSPPTEARSLILKLAGVLPRYRLPAGAGAHTRHFMPLGMLDKGREKTTLVFDTWAQVDDGELAVTWDVELTDAESEVLTQLAEHLGYLGRSESWVVARVAEPVEMLPESNCRSEAGHANPGPGWEQIPLMAPVSPDGPEHYAEWRLAAVTEALVPFPLPEKKAPKKLLEQRAKAEAPYPNDLIACLQADTTWLRSHGWSQPPGSRRVFYWRRTDALEAGAPRPRRAASAILDVEAMLLSLSTASGNDHALPNVTRTLPQAEMLHKHLGDALKRLGLGHSRALSGCDELRERLTERHAHAHILPLDLDGDGHLEHVLIWASMGLDATAQAAIRAVRQTYTKGGIAPLKLALEAAGSLADLRHLSGGYGDGLHALLGPEQGATEWISLTPFVPPRHLKARGKNCLEGQIAAELASRGFPEPLEIEVCDPRHQRWLRFRHFVRTRRNGPAAPIDCGFPVSVRLARPHAGPLCLGYGSHFGLGIFAAITPD